MKQEVRRIKCVIKGVAPLLMHRYADEDQEENKPKTKTRVLPSLEEATKALYTAGKTVVQPARTLEASMLKASSRFRLEGKSTYLNVVKGGVFIEPDLIPHKFQEWVVDRQPEVIQNGKMKNRIMRSRPRFDKWGLEFELVVIDDRAEIATLKEILIYSGLYYGLGDRRPRYGRFEVTKWEEQKT